MKLISLLLDVYANLDKKTILHLSQVNKTFYRYFKKKYLEKWIWVNAWKTLIRNYHLNADYYEYPFYVKCFDDVCSISYDCNYCVYKDERSMMSLCYYDDDGFDYGQDFDYYDSYNGPMECECQVNFDDNFEEQIKVALKLLKANEYSYKLYQGRLKFEKIDKEEEEEFNDGYDLDYAEELALYYEPIYCY